ncbi:MAG: EF-P beta-lysylation protein EpmB [Candidatus Competibacteraceae bacterium]|jgi:EF-P beta-lysylation protein EpmB|nr:EF-P beta-lysylation protein EpmB [Candidatus Competibacteraceae bacterium]
MNPVLTALLHAANKQRDDSLIVTDPAELFRLLDLDPALLAAAQTASGLFSLRVPRSYVARMRKRDPNDPLLRQVLPIADETIPTPGFTSDPVGDCQALVAPGVLHKYQGRVLLMTTGACGIHCRYCFRRDFPYAQSVVGTPQRRVALDYLANQPDVSEVILSGGDPLSLSNRRLAVLLEELAAVPHLRRLRIHSRQPIVMPERIDSALLELLNTSRFKVVMVVHVNHPQEIDKTVRASLARLAAADVCLFNQAVLLRAVNDSVDTLVELSEALFSAGVIPYYLHLLDRVRGTAHFEVSEDRARQLMEELRRSLPGYLVPRLVREQPGKPAKIPIL